MNRHDYFEPLFEADWLAVKSNRVDYFDTSNQIQVLKFPFCRQR